MTILEIDLEPFIFKLILFSVCLFFSAFFSSSETAYFSLSKIKLQHLKERGIPPALRVVKLLEQPKQLLVTILIGNTLVNVSAATIAALLTADLSVLLGFSHNFALFLEIIVVILILLVLGEITPKVIAVKNAVAFSQKVSFLLQIFSFIFYPISYLLARFTTFLSSSLGIQDVGVFFSQEELEVLLEVGEEKGAIEEDEKEMIHSIFEFSQTSVREIMVPRIDMVCVEKNTSLDELIDIIKGRGFTRIPLYQDRVDNILGTIHAKDLLPYIKPGQKKLESEKIDLTSLARPVQFVPENKKIDELLREFQQEKNHLAIVVDEYGGTAGLITLEDVLEEIVGEIQDEYDTEGPLIKRIDNKTFLVDGKMNIHELQEILEIPFPASEAYDTLAGLIFDRTGYVPKANEKIVFEHFDLVIEKIVRNRIILVRILLKDQITE